MRAAPGRVTDAWRVRAGVEDENSRPCAIGEGAGTVSPIRRICVIRRRGAGARAWGGGAESVPRA